LVVLFLLKADIRTQADERGSAAVNQPEQVRDAAGTVTITDSTTGAVIRYTLDGSSPDDHSGPYLAPIELPAGGPVRARAFFSPTVPTIAASASASGLDYRVG
jgi:hypothetical protein